MTFEPTKLRVVAAVDNEDPSSCTVMALASAERVSLVIVKPLPIFTPPLVFAAAVGKT